MQVTDFRREKMAAHFALLTGLAACGPASGMSFALGAGSATLHCDNSTLAGVALCNSSGFSTTLDSNTITYTGSVSGVGVVAMAVRTNGGVPHASRLLLSMNLFNATTTKLRLWVDVLGFNYTTTTLTPLMTTTASHSLSPLEPSPGTVSLVADAYSDAYNTGYALNATHCTAVMPAVCSGSVVWSRVPTIGAFSLRMLNVYTITPAASVLTSSQVLAMPS